jgi:hypothetical protein
MLGAAMPADWLCSRLMEITRAALDGHYGLSPATDLAATLSAKATDETEHLVSRYQESASPSETGAVS